MEVSAGQVPMQIDSETLEKFRLKLSYKVRHHVGSACPDVEDLVQETLVRFLRFAEEDRIRNPENLGAFLNGICNNVIFEYRRKLSREQPYEPELHKDRQTVEPQAELMETRQAIDAALAELSGRDHGMLRAFYLEDKSSEEICRTLGATHAQFRVALFRARERFRRIYCQRLKSRVAD
jgi:RNA polymerase sigma-70 factor, ECF subfamily